MPDDQQQSDLPERRTETTEHKSDDAITHRFNYQLEQNPRFQPVSYPRDTESQVILSSKNVSIPFHEFYVHITTRNLNNLLINIDPKKEKVIIASDLYLEISRAPEVTAPVEFKGRFAFFGIGMVAGILIYVILFDPGWSNLYWPIMGLAIFGGFGVGFFFQQINQNIIRPWKQEFGRKMAE